MEPSSVAPPKTNPKTPSYYGFQVSILLAFLWVLNAMFLVIPDEPWIIGMTVTAYVSLWVLIVDRYFLLGALEHLRISVEALEMRVNATEAEFACRDLQTTTKYLRKHVFK